MNKFLKIFKFFQKILAKVIFCLDIKFCKFLFFYILDVMIELV